MMQYINQGSDLVTFEQVKFEREFQNYKATVQFQFQRFVYLARLPFQFLAHFSKFRAKF